MPKTGCSKSLSLMAQAEMVVLLFSTEGDTDSVT
jgi:hypothetical protein